MMIMMMTLPSRLIRRIIRQPDRIGESRRGARRGVGQGTGRAAHRTGVPAAIACIAAAVLGSGGVARAQEHPAGDPAPVYRELNRGRSVAAAPDASSFRLIFDAYLEMTPPPMPIGTAFNHTTIHPGMARWAEVAGWAETNQSLVQALVSAQERFVFGLPYGRSAVPPQYAARGLYAEVAVDGDLRRQEFPYLRAVDTIAAFAIAEAYRRCEADRTHDAMEVLVAYIFFLRSVCDREFLHEVFYTLTVLNEALANLRDVVYVYLDRMLPADLAELAMDHVPFLRPDRNRLFMPEGDRLVAGQIIQSIFDERTGQPDRGRFAQTFASIQSTSEPLTQFGAMRRWRMIADIHDSRESSLSRLGLVYDDWWRRWRVEEYDPILAVPTQFTRTNVVRYAAVVYALQDIQDLFPLRNELIAAVNGTAMSLGLAGYRRSLGTYPTSIVSLYAQFVRKRTDLDPFDRQFGRLQYATSSAARPLETPYGRVTVPGGIPLLWSLGRDHEDGRAREHSDDGVIGDIVYWPPVKALQRQAGIRD
ncbi:MAG: hypothetical protein KF817_14440 [Phycisphaeraceae bacterium]|nr:hypothetical protein [Phycisphaeraceae bacterium]